MAWPSEYDYRTMVQQPRMVFNDPRLQACTVGTYPNGQPKGSQGAFAMVYRMLDGSWSRAVRFFKKAPRPDQEERYIMLSRAISKANARGLIEFSYDPEGLRWGAARYPVLTMQWVEGQTLGVWLKESVLRGDSAGIGRMADAWVELVADLQTNGIAHGDLQHGNVMVENGRPVLVDYDCMYVPEMTTEAQRTPTEFGLPGYQHPGRPNQLLSPDLDNFSAWVILIALRAIADDLGLWRNHVEARDTENLLLTQSDLDDLNAPVWDDLIRRAKSKDVRDWAESLRESIKKPFGEIPQFGINVWEELEAAVKKGDWREIQTLATGAKYASRSFPPDLAPKVEEAVRRVECLASLGAKARTNRVREIAAAYRPELLDDWTEAATLVAKAKTARQAVGLLDELDRTEKGDGSGRAFVALWGRRGKELQGLAEADTYQAKVESWRKRIEAAARVVEAVKRGTPEKAIVDAWETANALGGHPDAEPHRARAGQAAKRAVALAKLVSLPAAQDEGADANLLKAWGAMESLLDGCPESVPFRDRTTAAQGRVKKLTELLRKIEAADQGRGDEETVADAADALPPGYGASQAGRVAKARGRIAASKALTQALRAVPPSDLAIASAADRSRADGSMPTDPAVVARCELAARRKELLRAMDALPTNLPLDEQDARWLASWDAALLDPCQDARGQRTRRDKAAVRTEAFASLERALAAGTAVEVKRLAHEAILADHPGLARRRTEIDALIATSEKIERLLNAVKRGAADVFFEEVEPSLLALNAATFLPHRQQIEAWVDARLARGDVLGAADPPFLPDSAGYTITARWTWGQTRLVRTCLVAADSSRFLDRPEEAKHGTQRLDPDTYRRTKGGTSLSIPQGTRKLYVTVWPVVDLGWDRRTGPPLKLGPYIAGASRPGRASSAYSAGRSPSRPWPKRVADWMLDFLNR